MAFIFIQSALPGELSSNESNFIVQFLVAVFDVNPGSVGFAVRKCAHFTEYLVLGMSTMLLFGEVRLSGLIAWAVGAGYAVTDEFHQLFVAGRSCEVRDMCIDAAGSAVRCDGGLVVEEEYLIYCSNTLLNMLKRVQPISVQC